MPPSRYELSEAQWERIRVFCPGAKNMWAAQPPITGYS
jgi:hypothetical protein